MLRIILKILTFTLPWIVNPSFSQEIWKENFTIPGKGTWCDRNGEVISDFSGITSWSLDLAGSSLSEEGSYAKTVITSGGRFECLKLKGEAVWLSEEIDISGYSKVNISLTAYETGSGNNAENKYLKAYYMTDDQMPVLFNKNGLNTGNWGSVNPEQKGLTGKKLQIICKMANHYSNDKVTLDNIRVWHEQIPVPPPERGDLLITEVLFNPFPGGKDYVEIYNPKKEKLLIDHLFLANRDKDLILKQVRPVFGSRAELMPGSWLVLTEDTQDIIQNYHTNCTESVHEVDNMPEFNIDEGYVVLLNEKSQVIDEMYYNENMHSEFLRNYKGVSLERVSADSPSLDKNNWQSASSASGYGTPGCKNSQQATGTMNSPVVKFEPDSFSPNGDGYNDQFIIAYSFGKPGFTGNIKIFDRSGRFVLSLVENEIPGTEGEYRWDGSDETGNRLPLGVYIVLAEFFNCKGEVYRFKDSVVLTEILD